MTGEELKGLMNKACDLVPGMPSDEWYEVLAELITEHEAKKYPPNEEG